MSERRAFTLVELLVALSLLAIAGATISRLVIGQQRFYASVNERLALRSRVRDGADVLTIALRDAAVQGSPITLATDTVLEVATIVGAASACGSNGVHVDLVPDVLSSALALTTLAVTPDTADEILVYDRSAPGAPQWRRARIIDVTTRSAISCALSPLLSASDVAVGRITELTIAPSIAATSGSPVRIVRRARFDVYRASDGLVYIGYRRCPAACTTVQPLAGPYGSNLANVILRYFDVAGSTLATPLTAAALARITRIDVSLRASSRGVLDLPGIGRGIAHDSTLASIALRNAP